MNAKRHTTIVLLAVMLLVTGCAAASDRHPEVIVDESSCGHCRMLISDPAHAAGIITADGQEIVYDDIRCLLESKTADDAASVWFHAFDEDRWISSEVASFVIQSRVKAPMGGDALAYPSVDEADSAARDLDGTVVRSFVELQARKGE